MYLQRAKCFTTFSLLCRVGVEWSNDTYIATATVQPHRDLHQCAELHFLLTGRDEGRVHFCIILGSGSITKFESPYSVQRNGNVPALLSGGNGPSESIIRETDLTAKRVRMLQRRGNLYLAGNGSSGV
jgi:hypothetical protein